MVIMIISGAPTRNCRTPRSQLTRIRPRRALERSVVQWVRMAEVSEVRMVKTINGSGDVGTSTASVRLDPIDEEEYKRR